MAGECKAAARPLKDRAARALLAAFWLSEEKVKAAVAITWAVTILCSWGAWAWALNALDQPRMLGAVKATPETMWPVEERLSVPYVTGGDNAPLCAPANDKPVP